MKRLTSTFLFCSSFLILNGQEYNTSWIANDGGWEESHIPHDMLNMYVHTDGTVATICNWDEGGTNVGVFRDGRLISRPEGSGTGGWGRFSGAQVVLDDKYVYQLLTQHGCDGGNDQLNGNGLRQFPPCDKAIEWKTIRRYDRETGNGAPFAKGYGYKGDMLVVCAEKERHMKGLAINADRLYVSVTGCKDTAQPDSVKIYNARTMEYIKGYPLPVAAGVLYADGRGGLWMMAGNSIIRMKEDTGERLAQTVFLPEGVEALSFSIDTQRGRLLLPNRGKDLNVLIYDKIFDEPVLVKTFGMRGGVFCGNQTYLKGQAGPLRFSGPAGAGVDAKGNIYVCNTTVSGGRGAVLEAYEEESRKALWKVEGLIFTATADIDRQHPEYMYTPEKIHLVDYTKKGERMDRLVAYTADPFSFPDDERVLKDGAFITSCWKRTIGGKSFMFVSDMYGGMIAGYRFDKEKHGYVGIPFLFANNGDPDRKPQKQPLRFWVDKNGDARRDAGEWANIDEMNQYSMSFFVDQKGNIWRGSRGQGILFWRMTGLNEHGIPQYDSARLFPLPEGTNGAKRVWYDAEMDELFVAGFSAERQDPTDTWWCMGSTIAKYSNFLKNANDKPLKADMRFFIPFQREDGNRNHKLNGKAFCVEGNFIFVSLAQEGIVHVYNRSDGKKWGELKPDDAVHKLSGWSDFNYCINAYRQPDGTYIVMNEENAFAKVMIYRMKE